MIFCKADVDTVAGDTHPMAMSETPTVGAFAILPSKDLPSAIPFW
jgi:hypothetical protein